MNNSELKKLISKKRVELAKIQVKIASGKEKNLKLANNIRKEIARLLTKLNQK
jgi:ribosomal protein L29